MVKDIYAGANGSFPKNLTAVGSTVYFQATTAPMAPNCGRATGRRPARSWSRTSIPGTAGSFAGGLVNVGGTLMFMANDGSHGYELWKSDGTSAGTSWSRTSNRVPAPRCRPTSPPSAAASSSRPTTGPTGTSCGRATGPAAARPGQGHQPGIRRLNSQLPDRDWQHPLLLRERPDPWFRVVEERRHLRRDRPGQGHRLGHGRFGPRVS